jgi:hypothetical protein
MHVFSKAPLLHGRYPASSLVWASPTPFRAAAPVMSFRRTLVAFAPTLKDLPGSSTDLSTRAAPNHPGRPGRCLPVASPPVSGFILVGGLTTFHFPNEAESGSLALRLACSPIPRSRQIDFSIPRLLGYMSEQAIYMVNSFQFTRSTRLILAYRP